MKKIQSAIISLSDKTNLKSLLQVLKKNNIKLISSGGTFKAIRKYGFSCLEVSEYTGTKEILDGRVKTLHPKIHAGILHKRDNKKHLEEIKKNNYENIDLVIVNFYPFKKVLEKTKNHKKVIENIDIGGPSLVRAAAKNYNDVTVISSIKHYSELINELNSNKGKTSLNFRKKMSRIAFSETAYYDSVIANYFNNSSKIFFPDKKTIYGNLIETLRYGENPHQLGAIYSENENFKIKKIHGKQLSFNNYNDIFSALNISKTLPQNTGTVIIKHANPCGVSIIRNNLKSYKSALECDPISAFGGIVLCNFKINKNLALELNKSFLEVIVAKGFDTSALKILKLKKNLRLVDSSNYLQNSFLKFNSVDNNFLAQTEDKTVFSKKNLKIVSRKKPNKSQLENLVFAFNICRHVKSNGIVLVSDMSTVGIGSGQPSRLDSCGIAVSKMQKHIKSKKEVVAASDAFFPFVDGFEKLIQNGVSAVIQPEGSIRDKEIINFADATNTILVFSKTRHFNH